MTERIEAAAINIRGVVHTQPAPARHHHIIRQYARDTGDPVMSDAVQGFLTSTGRFVGRHEAYDIAWDAEQITERHSIGQLFSEDLW